MGNSKTTYDKKVQKDKERIKAKATGRKLSGQADPSSAANLPEPALYASTRNWIRRSNLHCYNVYCCDRCVPCLDQCALLAKVALCRHTYIFLRDASPCHTGLCGSAPSSRASP